MDGNSNTEFYYKQMKPFKCGKCLNNFDTQGKLKFHTELVHAKGIYQCAKCDFTCKGIGQITLHNHKHIREKYFNTVEAIKPITDQELQQNDKTVKSGENEYFSTQRYRSDDSDEENNFVPYNENLLIGNSYNNDKRININSHNEKKTHFNHKAELHQNDKTIKYGENDLFSTQRYRSDDSDEENDFVPYNENVQIENSYNNDKHININSHNENKTQFNHKAENSNNTDNDFIGFKNKNLEIENTAESTKNTAKVFRGSECINQSEYNISSSCSITNADTIIYNFDNKEEKKYVKALDCIKNKNIEINIDPIEQVYIIEGNQYDNVYNVDTKKDEFKTIASFLDLINDTTETKAKLCDETSQKEIESENIYTQNYNEEQFNSININLATLPQNIMNTSNQLDKPVCKNVGSTNEVKKLMLKVQKVDNQFRCPECQKLYQNSSLVRRHLLIHTGEYPFECTKCDSAFNQNIQLQKHMKKIHNEGLFKCIHCDETFVQKIHLTRHNIEHTGAAPFTCTFCLKTFLLYRDVRKHMRDEHNYNEIKMIQATKRKKVGINETENISDFLTNNLKDKNVLKDKSLELIEHSSKNEISFTCLINSDFKTSPSTVKNPASSYAEKNNIMSMKCIDLVPLPFPGKSTNTQTPSMKQNIYKCIYCNETFKNITTYDFHLKIHEVESDSDFSLPDINE